MSVGTCFHNLNLFFFSQHITPLNLICGWPFLLPAVQGCSARVPAGVTGVLARPRTELSKLSESRSRPGSQRSLAALSHLQAGNLIPQT